MFYFSKYVMLEFASFPKQIMFCSFAFNLQMKSVYSFRLQTLLSCFLLSIVENARLLSVLLCRTKIVQFIMKNAPNVFTSPSAIVSYEIDYTNTWTQLVYFAFLWGIFYIGFILCSRKNTKPRF